MYVSIKIPCTINRCDWIAIFTLISRQMRNMCMVLFFNAIITAKRFALIPNSLQALQIMSKCKYYSESLMPVTSLHYERVLDLFGHGSIVWLISESFTSLL